MTTLIGTLIGLAIVVVVSALIIYLVGRLGLGLTVDNFGSAVIAAVVIGVIAALVNWLLGLIGIDLTGSLSIIGSVVALVVSALVLLLSDRFVKGMKVNGFGGAIIAAIAIGVVSWLVLWLLGLFGINTTVL
jgi:putative membrane protein